MGGESRRAAQGLSAASAQEGCALLTFHWPKLVTWPCRTARELGTDIAKEDWSTQVVSSPPIHKHHQNLLSQSHVHCHIAEFQSSSRPRQPPTVIEPALSFLMPRFLDPPPLLHCCFSSPNPPLSADFPQHHALAPSFSLCGLSP